MISIEIIHIKLLNANESEDISSVFFTSGSTGIWFSC